MIISKNKREYIEYDFEKKYQEDYEMKIPMTINGDMIGKVKKCKHLE